MLSRAVLIGDVHTEHVLLAEVLDHAAAARVDRILCVGDIVDGPRDPLACIDLLRDHDVDVVRGNHERWVNQGNPMEPFDYPPAYRGWLDALPATRRYATPRGPLLLGHGTGTDDMVALAPHDEGYALEAMTALWDLVHADDVRVLVGGHSHCAMVRQVEHLTVLNPGTLVAHQDPGYLLVDFAAGTVERWLLRPQHARLQAWTLR